MEYTSIFKKKNIKESIIFILELTALIIFRTNDTKESSVASIKQIAEKSIKELMEINKVSYCSPDAETQEIEYVIEYQRAVEDPVEMTKMIWYNIFNYAKKNHFGEFSYKDAVVKVHHKKKTIKLSIMMEIGTRV